MSVAFKAWTDEQFFAWAQRQDEGGERPVRMPANNIRHGLIMQNIHAALRSRLRGTVYENFGLGVGIRTAGRTIRYPDGCIVPRPVPGSAHIAPDPIVVFEVISPDSGRRDRIERLREYAAVPSIRRYVIVESAGIGLTVLHKPEGGDAFTALPLLAEDTLHLPEIGIEVRVAEFYLDVEFDDDAPSI